MGTVVSAGLYQALRPVSMLVPPLLVRQSELQGRPSGGLFSSIAS
jgi:hypothetical protein